ncbi:MAG: DUF1844 domain-containing protein [Deltaproteobacteria bacterium]|nr:DUF1844 domain-containing protein [Deltaproteobacteria bacterium]
MAEEEKGFVIKDKRIFPQGPESAEQQEEQKPSEEAPSEKKEPEEEAGAQLPEITFSTFIFSLSSSALLHLGEIPDPGTGSKKEDLPLAKQTIDILGMLDEKTEGNLTSDEKNLLSNILYDLRMRYIAKKK